MGVKGGSQSSNSQGTGSGRSAGYNESGGFNISRSVSGSTPGFMTELGSVLQSSLAGTGPYSKQSALADVNGVLRTQALDAMQSAMPSIYKNSRAAGAYNSTTEDLLVNDFSARLAGQLAQTQLQAVRDYGQLDNQRIAAFAGATGAGTTQQSVQESIGMQAALGLQEALNQNQQTSSGSGWNAGIGLQDGGQVPVKGYATGGKIMEAPDSLITAGSSPFTLLNEYFNFDGSGRRGRLSVLPEILGYGSQVSDVVPAPAPSTAPAPAPAPAPASAPAAEEPALNPAEYMPLSQAAIEFMRANEFKDFHSGKAEYDKHMKSGTLFALKGVEGLNTDQPNEFRTADVMYGRNAAGMEFAADGGQVGNNVLRSMFPENMFAEARRRREVMAGLEEEEPAQSGAVVINVNAGPKPQKQQQPQQREPSFFDEITNMLRDSMRGRMRDSIRGNYADGGPVQDTNKLQAAMQRYAQGGDVPHIDERTNNSGKLGGPQSNSGRDNQLVAVAGGEGVIPVDVMEVDGVPQLLQSLIKTYHKPVK